MNPHKIIRASEDLLFQQVLHTLYVAQEQRDRSMAKECLYTLFYYGLVTFVVALIGEWVAAALTSCFATVTMFIHTKVERRLKATARSKEHVTYRLMVAQEAWNAIRREAVGADSE